MRLKKGLVSHHDGPAREGLCKCSATLWKNVGIARRGKRSAGTAQATTPPNTTQTGGACKFLKVWAEAFRAMMVTHAHHAHHAGHRHRHRQRGDAGRGRRHSRLSTNNWRCLGSNLVIIQADSQRPWARLRTGTVQTMTQDDTEPSTAAHGGAQRRCSRCFHKSHGNGNSNNQVQGTTADSPSAIAPVKGIAISDVDVASAARVAVLLARRWLRNCSGPRTTRSTSASASTTRVFR